MYTEIEQQTLGIDWFLPMVNVSFMESGGGKLPKSIAKSKKANLILTSYFRNLLEIIINPDLNKLMKELVLG